MAKFHYSNFTVKSLTGKSRGSNGIPGPCVDGLPCRGQVVARRCNGISAKAHLSFFATSSHARRVAE